MARNNDDAAYGLTPREWLETDAVPLTPDIDLNDPEQRHAWIRANNEENRQRMLELRARREGGGSRAESGAADDAVATRLSTTTVVGVRFLNAEQRALVRVARREGVAVSDLIRRWVRAAIEAANAVDVPLLEPDEQREQREAMAAAADAIVVRIADEVRRLREIVTSGG